MDTQNTAATPEVLTLPEVITLGGIAYNVQSTPELKALVSTVAKVEKRKLYSQIEAVKGQVDQLSKINVEPDQAFKDSIISEVKNVIAEQIKPLLEKTNQIQTESLEDFRQKLIAANADKCIPEIVKGNTKEEIEASLQESIAIRAKYPSANVPYTDPNKHVTDPLLAQQAKELENAGNNAQNSAAPTSTPPQTTPVINLPRISVTEPVQSNVGRMSQEEFARNREALKANLQALV